MSPRKRLFRKYVVPIIGVVGIALLASGGIGVYFSYVQTRSALLELEHEKAASAAHRIEGFVREIEHQIGWTSLPQFVENQNPLQLRRVEYLKLLRQVPAIMEVSFIDREGREQVRVSRLAMDVLGAGRDLSDDPRFTAARTGRTYFGPVHFRKETEPYMAVAMRAGRDGAGVTAVEVNLKFILDVVQPIKIGKSGLAYVVDRDGHLVAHPDISLVLQKTDLSALPQVKATLAGTTGADQSVTDARDRAGRAVLTAFARIEPLGWTVFVEQPAAEAYAPIYAQIARGAAVVLVCIMLAVLASLTLARRMVRPINALRDGAAAIGGGDLDKRIEVRTGDELQDLADRFNDMADRLRQSYLELERKVAVRTRELQEKSHELEIANQHKSEFLANMSHELRTPLNAVIGFSEVLAERYFGDLNAKQAEYVADIHSSGTHLLSLINDILDLSKVEAGRMELEPSEFDLKGTLQNATTLVRERAHRQGIALKLELASDLGSIRADERKVKQIMLNLLSNAVNFTPEGGAVSVCATRANGAVEIAVSDTGMGIAAEDHEAVFQEFRQVGRDYTKKAEGTGLGLPLARRFAELHGGTIRVASALGQGSTFTLVIPFAHGE
jgi:two-component system, NtrC family, sensor kinase